MLPVFTFVLGITTIILIGLTCCSVAYAVWQQKQHKVLLEDKQAHQVAFNALVDHVGVLSVTVTKIQPLVKGEERLSQLEKRVDDLTTQNAFGKNFVV